jgi:hypothetical protein
MIELKIKEGANGAFFIYDKNKLIVGGHDKKIIDLIFEFLNNNYERINN